MKKTHSKKQCPLSVEEVINLKKYIIHDDTYQDITANTDTRPINGIALLSVFPAELSPLLF